MATKQSPNYYYHMQVVLCYYFMLQFGDQHDYQHCDQHIDDFFAIVNYEIALGKACVMNCRHRFRIIIIACFLPLSCTKDVVVSCVWWRRW